MTPAAWRLVVAVFSRNPAGTRGSVAVRVYKDGVPTLVAYVDLTGSGRRLRQHWPKGVVPSRWLRREVFNTWKEE